MGERGDWCGLTIVDSCALLPQGVVEVELEARSLSIIRSQYRRVRCPLDTWPGYVCTGSVSSPFNRLAQHGITQGGIRLITRYGLGTGSTSMG